MNYYDEIKEKLIDNEINRKVKDYSKERYRVITYFEIGKLLSEAGSKYGDNIIGKYSEKLMIEVGKNIKSAFENKTVGIIICKKNNKFYMEYCYDDRKNAIVYEIVL